MSAKSFLSFFHKNIPAWHTLRLPLLISLLWCLLLFALYHWTILRENEYAEDSVRLQTGTFYSCIVAVRDWNAAHGGVWVIPDERCPANPWIPENTRSLRMQNGKELVLVNPAYMTRQISDFATASLATFRIVGQHPFRPGNQADAWETQALESFSGGKHEAFTLEREKYRYMAPLQAEKSCLACHHESAQGDLLGGISVSVPAAPILENLNARKKTVGIAYFFIGGIGILGIGGATLQINRKKEEAEVANRMKSVFLANMSHDMRTPLTGILGIAELLESDANDIDHRRMLASLGGATKNLLDLVDGIMRYSLLEVEGRPQDQTFFSLKATIDFCLQSLRPTCDYKNNNLLLEIDDKTPDIFIGDAFRLRQALGNLLGNAVKFTDGGSVQLKVDSPVCSENACMVRFKVIDTGCGILPEDQGRIFEKFVQTGKNTHGAGLGLGIARQIARHFGGDITVNSTLGQGSEFTLTAFFRPAPKNSPPSLPKHEKMEKASPDLTGCRVLLAEDTSLNALFFEEVLRRAGAMFCLAQNAPEALDKISQFRPDLALLDMRIPGGSGLSVAESIRAGNLPNIASNLPIVLLSAANSQEQEAESAKLGIAYLLKPIRAEQLLQIVNTLWQATKSAKQDFDSAAALDDLDGNEDLLRRLCLLFLEESSEVRTELLDLKRSFDQADLQEIQRQHCQTLRRQAHRIKNGAATLHLGILQSSAAEIETVIMTAKQKTGSDFSQAFAQLRQKIPQLLAIFDQACAVLQKTTTLNTHKI